MLRQKAEGGEQWLLALRGQSLDEAVTSLCTLPGIGPKVAACIALFSLDQHHAIPVDTHVWQVCSNYDNMSKAVSSSSFFSDEIR